MNPHVRLFLGRLVSRLVGLSFHHKFPQKGKEHLFNNEVHNEVKNNYLVPHFINVDAFTFRLILKKKIRGTYTLNNKYVNVMVSTQLILVDFLKIFILFGYLVTHTK